MKPEETIDFHFRWIWAKISRLYNVEAAKSGGSMSIGYTLLNIDKEGTPSTKLGPKMGMESRSLTRTLSSMEQNGLIERRKDEFDKRMSLVFLTDKGIEMRDRARDTVLNFNEFVQKHIDKQELETFLKVMTDLNALLERKDIFNHNTTSPEHT